MVDLLERSLRDTLSGTSDNAIEKFTASFKELRGHFCSKSALTTWRLVDTVHKDIVQLGCAIEGLNAIGTVFSLLMTANFNITDLL